MPDPTETSASEDKDREPDRRPIAARQVWIFQRMAHVLARWGVSPNLISILGMVCGIAAGWALWETTEKSAALPPGHLTFYFLTAALLIQLRLLANMLDGMVAMESGKTSRVGELFNEVPDRISDVAVLVGAGWARTGHVELGYLAACVALFTAYVRAVGKGAGAPQEFCGPMAKQQRMFTITAVALYLGLTPADWQPDRLMAWALVVIIVLGLVTAARRLGRIARNLTTMERG